MIQGIGNGAVLGVVIVIFSLFYLPFALLQVLKGFNIGGIQKKVVTKFTYFSLYSLLIVVIILFTKLFSYYAVNSLIILIVLLTFLMVFQFFKRILDGEI